MPSSRTTVLQSRRYDHVYDLTHTTASTLDFVKSTEAAAKLTVERVPDKQNMFSQIPSKYKTHSLRVSKKVDLPPHIDANSVPVAPPMEPSTSNQVSGFHRAKFFRRPVAPLLQSVPPHILLAKAVMDPAKKETGKNQNVATYSRVKDVGMQTMYRESEAQTDPFTPDYVIQEGSDPEVLKLAKMSFANGDLPANLREVELIERMRYKRLLEQSLPPITDEASFMLRRSLMERLEMFHFHNRNKDIDEVQGERLRYMKKALESREAEKEFNAEQRIEQLRRQELVLKDRTVAGIQRNRIKALRKLSRSQRDSDPLAPRGRNIIKEYSQYSSRVYAPILREGQFSNTTNHELNAIFAHTKDVFQLEELEKSIPDHVLNLSISSMRHKRSSGRLSSHEKRKQHIRLHLDRMDHFIKQKNGSSDESAGYEASQDDAVGQTGGHGYPSRNYNKKADKLERPETPRIDTCAESEIPADDEYNCAIQLLQRLIKGRAVQNAMYYGKEKRIHLINELRTEESRTSVEHDNSKAEEHQKQMVVDSILSALGDAMLCRSLQHLAHEKRREIEGDRIRDLMQQGEEFRRVREVEELGRRQAEETKRSVVENMTYQAMEVQRAAVDSFLDETIQNVILGFSGHYGNENQGETLSTSESLRSLAKATVNSAAATTANKVETAREFQSNPSQDDREYLAAAQRVVLETMQSLNLVQ